MTSSNIELLKDKEAYIEHELRIRIGEYKNSATNRKLNALIMIAITGVIIPCLFKYFGS
jgi:hypothetical protein